MSASPEIIQNCSGCGATIYPEHFQRGLAVRQSGKLLCRHCVTDSAAPMPAMPVVADAASLGLTDQPTAGDRTGGSSLYGHSASEAMYKKPMYKSATAATRVRNFHAKLSEGAMLHLDQQVNSWLDTHPDVEIKFASTAVGTWEGKHPEPNLILTIFY